MATTARAVGLACSILVLASCAAPARTSSIEIRTRATAYELTVPVSRLTVSIPKAGLLPATPPGSGGSASPRYFYMEDRALNLIVSGWFEPAQRYPGVRKLWSNDTDAWRRRKLPDPHNVVFSTVEKWDVVTYDMPVPAATNSHVRAQRVQAGTWIDLHLSITSRRSSRENRARLHGLLAAIRVDEKDVTSAR